MANNKTAQIAFPIPLGAPPVHSGPNDMVVLDEPQVASGPTDAQTEITFNINVIPGAPPDVTFDEDVPEEIIEEPSVPEEEVVEEDDEWNWEKGGLKNFLGWLKSRVEGIPKHSGKDTTGIERAIAYFKRLNVEISRAMTKDFKREIDAAKAEEARRTIVSGMKALNKRLKQLQDKLEGDERKKKASFRAELIKKADTSTPGNITINVPYFISFIARSCINASVSNGKDMKDTFVKLAKEYKLDRREKVQVIQLIKDMGYPLVLDRLRVFEGKLEMDNPEGEFSTQFYA